MPVTLRERDFESFFAAPFEAYGENSLYVSPMKGDLKRFLSTTENPLFSSDDEITYFTALRDGRPIGPITAHVHGASNAQYGWNRCYFGYFDCADDAEAAATSAQGGRGLGPAARPRRDHGQFQPDGHAADRRADRRASTRRPIPT